METKTYLYQPEKAFIKQGALLTDEEGNVVYEAKCLKQSLIGPSEFVFVNHLTNTSETHKIGHTVTQETSGGIIPSLLTTRSHFKYDGKKIWDYLHEQDVRLETGMQEGRLGFAYDVTVRGEKVAEVKTSTKNGTGLITTNVFFDVITDEEHLDLGFLVAFAVARTNQAILS